MALDRSGWLARGIPLAAIGWSIVGAWVSPAQRTWLAVERDASWTTFTPFLEELAKARPEWRIGGEPNDRGRQPTRPPLARLRLGPNASGDEPGAIRILVGPSGPTPCVRLSVDGTEVGRCLTRIWPRARRALLLDPFGTLVEDPIEGTLRAQPESDPAQAVSRLAAQVSVLVLADGAYEPVEVDRILEAAARVGLPVLTTAPWVPLHRVAASVTVDARWSAVLLARSLERNEVPSGRMPTRWGVNLSALSEPPGADVLSEFDSVLVATRPVR